MKTRERLRSLGVALTPSGKELALDRFYEQLDREGLTATQLAHEAGVGRAYLTRVLNGHETGMNTWRKVLPLLSEAALFHAKQCSAWNSHAQLALNWLHRIRAINGRIEAIKSDFGMIYVLRHPMVDRQIQGLGK